MTDPVHEPHGPSERLSRLRRRWRHRHDDEDREPDMRLVHPIRRDSEEGRRFDNLIADLDPFDRYNR